MPVKKVQKRQSSRIESGREKLVSLIEENVLVFGIACPINLTPDDKWTFEVSDQIFVSGKEDFLGNLDA